MIISDSIKTLIRTTAPTLLTALALPPPFNVIAAAVVSGVLEKYLPDTAPGDKKTALPVAGNEAGAENHDIPSAGTISMTPDQVVVAIEKNTENPQILPALRQAEIDLKKYETDAGIRFAEINLENTKSIQEFQEKSGISLTVFNSGMSLVKYSLLGLVLLIIGCVVFVFVPAANAANSQLFTPLFGLIGTVVGFVNGIAANVVGFYWGSSQGSKQKSDDIAVAMQKFGDSVSKTAEEKSVSPAAIKPLVEIKTQLTEPSLTSPRTMQPVTPAKLSDLADGVPELQQSHKYLNTGVNWLLNEKGISIDGADPEGTFGKPVTVETIWQQYGESCSTYAKRYGVPVELIVATIAVESGGDKNARRAEPQINDESVGLMQTLVGTAKGALGLKTLDPDELLQPELSINAGTAYIAQQRGTTHFDPPKVAAAYNAGSVYTEVGERNRWKMRCYPVGTGQHIDKFVSFFNDCMQVSRTQNWSKQGDVPSFITYLP
ncbi:lytic transglycosylase domain-containing protein [Rahnella sp. PD12R]|uniref:transglycosylase SLT domain-containing protein n=1 Tax=Rahnella sp. PD12R TaxID=2855688 RepID=UPI001C4696A3|nr:transglycosylase SLT domain-containing protein [Rahnella sp. PD12R]MBV6817191.1 lytic transglycosylase domain-containing protein [Rahnella sp. PD12R]